MFHGSLHISINVRPSFISVHRLHVVPAVKKCKEWTTLKKTDVQQAKMINNFKDVKQKQLKTKAAMWFN
jgi:hypothetical protein